MPNDAPRPTKKIYAVIYNLTDTSRNYRSLYNELIKKGWRSYWESPFLGAYLISTDETPIELANRLREHTDPADSLIVIEVMKDHYFGWLPQEAWDWIKSE